MQRSCVRKRLNTRSPRAVRTSSEKDVGILTHSEQLKASVTRANNLTCAPMPRQAKHTLWSKARESSRPS